MTEEVLKRWMFNIYLDLKELSDVEFQKLAWFAKVPNYISDYAELYNRLFSDFSIEIFINKELPKLGVSNLFVKEILTMVRMMKHYDEKGKTHTQILEDPEWHKISDQAKVVLGYWNKELGIPTQPE